MKEIYRARDLQEAHFLKTQLEAANIASTILNEHTYNLRGAVPMMDSLPTLQVSDSDVEKAKKLIQQYEEPRLSQPTNQEWICKKCSQTNPNNFAVCWKCGADFSGIMIKSTNKEMQEQAMKDASAKKSKKGGYLLALTFGLGMFFGFYLNQLDIFRSNQTRIYKIDLNQDGLNDRFYYYYPNGSHRVEEDYNFDGKIDNWIFYNGLGSPTKAERDSNFDGRVDTWTFFNEMGLVTKLERDTDFNGSADVFQTFDYNNRILIKTQTFREPRDKPILETDYKHGIPIYGKVDENEDGKFDYQITYDSAGKIVEKKHID